MKNKIYYFAKQKIIEYDKDLLNEVKLDGDEEDDYKLTICTNSELVLNVINKMFNNIEFLNVFVKKFFGEKGFFAGFVELSLKKII